MTAAARADLTVLTDRVQAADPAALLPDLRRGEEGRLVLPLRVVAAAALPGRAGWAALLVDGTGACLGAPLVDDGAGAVRRARAGDGAAQALLEALRGGVVGPLSAVLLHDVDATGERAVGVDQTHDSVVVGTASAGVVVKWAVHVEPAPGSPPAVAALRHLDAVGFTRTPVPVGFLVHDDGERQALLASVAGLLPGAQDGWDWCVDDVLGLVDGTRDEAQVLGWAAELGDLVAAMHVAFATPWADDPHPVGRAGSVQAREWLDSALGTVDEALSVTTGAPGERLRARAAAARSVIGAGLDGAEGTPLTRVHGDLHVGQVLRWPSGLAVSDFDGNPVLPAVQRSLPQPPARDVAGMLRALDHVGRVVDRRTSWAARDRVAAWSAWARDGFLHAYRGTLADAGHEGLLDERLLAAFEVEQECRELVYAARHLPRWTYVPDAALTDLLPED